MKKIIFNSVLIVGISACVQMNPNLQMAEEPYVESNGKVEIQAEKPHALSENADIKLNSSENEGVYVQRISANESSTKHKMQYQLQINTPGKYRIWARVKGNVGSETLDISVEGEDVQQAGEKDQHEEFTWVNQNASYTFDTGSYAMEVFIKESDVWVDKFMLIRDQQVKPEGNVEVSEIMEDADEIITKLMSGREQQNMLVPFKETYGDYSLADAYALQDKLSGKLQEELGPVIGYKMAFATESAMKKFNLNEPVYGPFFEKQKVENQGTLNLDEFMQFHIENEITFVTKEIKEQVQSIAELKKYVKSIHLGFDMADGRFDRSNGREGINDFIASGGGAHRFMVGKAIEGIDHDLADEMLYVKKDGEVIYEGNSNEAYNNPWNALLWIVNDLLENGKEVKEDMYFLTGKVDDPYVPAPENAKGYYLGTCQGFPDVECTIR